MQTLIVVIIVIAAAAYLIRRFYRKIKATEANPCGCSCDGCSETKTCEDFSVTKKS